MKFSESVSRFFRIFINRSKIKIEVFRLKLNINMVNMSLTHISKNITLKHFKSQSEIQSKLCGNFLLESQIKLMFL
jgi:hypothetical protein